MDLRSGHEDASAPREVSSATRMKDCPVLLRVGYEFTYHCTLATPMLLYLNIHSSRAADIVVPDHVLTVPPLPVTADYDAFGNLRSRLVAPAGDVCLTADAVVRDSGEPDAVVPDARQHAVQDLPGETLQYLLGSRYCETDLFTTIAWDLFGGTAEGWPRVQAICDFVHERVTFGYEHARVTKTAWDTYNEREGVCRDYTHLGIALCRSMNIPARYCTGYLGDVGTLPPYGVGDFAAWFEAYLDGRWHTFDPRHNVPRIGRVLVARGRDAADVPLSHSFGPHTLTSFTVWTDVIEESPDHDHRSPAHGALDA
jgi:transglutaminase-like putative cysteine protease